MSQLSEVSVFILIKKKLKKTHIGQNLDSSIINVSIIKQFVKRYVAYFSIIVNTVYLEKSSSTTIGHQQQH